MKATEREEVEVEMEGAEGGGRKVRKCTPPTPHQMPFPFALCSVSSSGSPQSLSSSPSAFSPAPW